MAGMVDVEGAPAKEAEARAEPRSEKIVFGGILIIFNISSMVLGYILDAKKCGSQKYYGLSLSLFGFSFQGSRESYTACSSSRFTNPDNIEEPKIVFTKTRFASRLGSLTSSAPHGSSWRVYCS